MPETHQPLAGVQRLLDVGLGIASPLDLLDHVQHPGRSAAVQRAGHRADRAGEGGGDIGAGGAAGQTARLSKPANVMNTCEATRHEV